MSDEKIFVEPPCYFLGRTAEDGQSQEVYCDGDGIPVVRMLRAEIEFIRRVLGLADFEVYQLTGKGQIAPPLWSQRDPRWKSHQLGFGTSTIGGLGCLVTSHAMGLSAMFGREITPPEFNDALKAVSGFTGSNRNCLIFSKVPAAFPEIELVTLVHCTTTPAPVAQIDEWLNAGYIVIIRIDMNLSTAEINQHWLLLVSGNGTDGYGFHDPWPLPEDQKELALPPASCKPGWNAARAIYSVVAYRRKADAS